MHSCTTHQIERTFTSFARKLLLSRDCAKSRMISFMPTFQFEPNARLHVRRQCIVGFGNDGVTLKEHLIMICLDG
eukprot:UN18820